jgi:diguanylate cyclase (GGDEF)-like protein
MEEQCKEGEQDLLTGLRSKTSFLKALDARIALSEAEGTLSDYVLVCFNICNFKYYNIKYGSAAGDRVLRDLAEGLARRNEGGLNGRFVSDRLAAVVPQQDAEQMICGLEQVFYKQYKADGLSIKAGIFPLTPGVSAAEACELADLACDAVRNKPEVFCYYDAQIHRRAESVSYIVQNLDRAIHKGWIQIYYQPMVRTLTDCLCGIEALVRWVDPERGIISPADFIPVLEDNQLITQLDLYVLDQVCRGMRQKMAERSELVPVSINLSRLDFLNCDIFREVERSVQRYGIARDLLNIEVTESIVMDESDLLKEAIARFRDAGYKVFMDDFGSGYSSLNVLRDYEFDEIKLDMVFLRHFDEKAKRVIRSAVSVAKGLGIEVLAEGVETEAQYAFLKAIGCDKAQGYYFSPPVPLEKFDALFAKSDAIEPRRFKPYYAAVRGVNFMTDKPLEIVDFDGQAFHSLYVNDEAKAVWRGMDFRMMGQVFDLVNDPASPFYQNAQESLARLRLNDPVRLAYNIFGTFVSLQVTLLAQDGDHRLLTVEAVSLGQRDEEDHGDENYIFRLLYTLYDEIYRINLKTLEFEPIKPGVNYLEMCEAWEQRDWKMDVKEAARLFIQLEDQSDYVKFADPVTLAARMAKADKGVFTGMFRSKGQHGAYIMKLHTIQPMPGSDYVLYSTQFVPQVQKQFEKKQLSWRPREQQTKADALTRDLWQTLRHSRVLSIFWKDKERRFIDVNDKFLDTCGITDRAAIVGKTDEEMHWHLDDGPFRDDEIAVIQKGASVVNRFGKCIIRGEVHDIIASKEPVYQDGKIVGLMGAFLPADEIRAELPDIAFDAKRHFNANLMTLRGITDIAGQYVEGWEYRKEQFAAISIQFDSYKRARQTYGSAIARKMIAEVSGRIAEFCGSRAVAGRTYGEHFAIFMKYEDRQTVADFRDAFVKRCRGVRELAGYPETLNPTVIVYYSEDTRNAVDMVFKACQNKFLTGNGETQ